MENTNYHHGDLKKSLIEMGLKLLNEKGVEGFSLRKVANMCNVSHSAPYNHFKNKEELIKEISLYVEEEFENTLKDIINNFEDNPKRKIIELGKKYVWFMVENPEYLKFLFLNNNSGSLVVDGNKVNETQSRAFSIFKECAIDYLVSLDIKKEEYIEDVIAMWAIVHGLAIMLSNKTLDYKGDYLLLVDKLLSDKLQF